MEDVKMYDDNKSELDPVIMDGYTVELKRRDPYGHVYLSMNGMELKDLGMFTTVDAARASAEIHIQEIKNSIKLVQDILKEPSTTPIKKIKKVA